MGLQVQRFLTGKARLIVFGLLVASAVYLLAVTPVTTYIDQRREMQATEARYEEIAEANERLAARVAELQTDAEIARLAREQYELVPEGQEAYAVMPPAANAAPAASRSGQDEGLWSKVTDTLSFWN